MVTFVVDSLSLNAHKVQLLRECDSFKEGLTESNGLILDLVANLEREHSSVSILERKNYVPLSEGRWKTIFSTLSDRKPFKSLSQLTNSLLPYPKNEQNSLDVTFRELYQIITGEESGYAYNIYTEFSKNTPNSSELHGVITTYGSYDHLDISSSVPRFNVTFHAMQVHALGFGGLEKVNFNELR